MLRPVDKLFLILSLIAFSVYYLRRWLTKMKIDKYKARSGKKDSLILESLEEQGYSIVNICKPKKVEYLKDSKVHVDFLEPKLVVRNQGKKYLVESYTKSQTISLRDNLVKLRILTNIACYNLNGVLFINSKGEAIKEFTVRVTRENFLFYIFKKILLLFAFTMFGFYISQIFL